MVARSADRGQSTVIAPVSVVVFPALHPQPERFSVVTFSARGNFPMGHMPIVKRTGIGTRLLVVPSVLISHIAMRASVVRLPGRSLL
jgi:hypothetical protein